MKHLFPVRDERFMLENEEFYGVDSTGNNVFGEKIIRHCGDIEVTNIVDHPTDFVYEKINKATEKLNEI